MPKRLEFTWKQTGHQEWYGTSEDFGIHIWLDEEYRWIAERSGIGQFADHSPYKTGCGTLNSAKWRAIKAVTKYRNQQDIKIALDQHRRTSEVAIIAALSILV